MYFEEWELIGQYFGFKPEFLPVQMTIRVFDWKSATPEMIALMRTAVPKPPKQKVGKAIHVVTRKHNPRWEAQGGLCFYCGMAVARNKMTKDHKTPKSRGGNGEPGNIVGACAPCNNAKGSMLFEEFLATDYLPEHRRTALGFTGKPKPFDRVKRLPRMANLSPAWPESSEVKYRPLG